LRIRDRLEKSVNLGHDTLRTASYPRPTGENDEEEDV